MDTILFASVPNYNCFTCTWKTYSLHAGWLDCPSFGQEIYGMIPSKVPLGESFRDSILPGKRYSFKQVIHQQRVLGRKVSRIFSKKYNTSFRFLFLCFLFFYVTEFSSILISFCLPTAISAYCLYQNNLEN